MEVKPTANVTLATSKGEIEIELFAKELPNLCRAFIENCASGNYNGLHFNKLTSSAVELLTLSHASELKHETHKRIKFDPRGSVGLLRVENTRLSSANGFFIALKPISEFAADYTFIGRVVGDSIYNVLKILEAERKPGSDEPVYPITIAECSVNIPYFEDIKTVRQVAPAVETKKKKPRKMVKLGFDDDEAEDEVGFTMKSAHELLGHGLKKKAVEDKASESKIMPDASSPVSEPKVTLNVEEPKDKETTNTPPQDDDTESAEKYQQPEAPEQSETTPGIQKTVADERDPSIDPYDPAIDLDKDSVTFEQLRAHKFVCR